MFTENEENAAPLTSMLFWTCTTAGAEPPPVEEVPVPVSLTVWFVPAALLSLSVTVRVALRLPAAVGLNVTLSEQLALAARVEGLRGQLLVWLKSPAFVPVMLILVMVKGSLPPVFVSVAV